jgi:hypothetical protein
MSPYLMSTAVLAGLSDADAATVSSLATQFRLVTTVAQAEVAAARLAATEVLVAALHAADAVLVREEAEGITPDGIVTRFVEARGDASTRHWLYGLAAEYDAAQPFGPRLVDELDALSDFVAAA